MLCYARVVDYSWQGGVGSNSLSLRWSCLRAVRAFVAGCPMGQVVEEAVLRDLFAVVLLAEVSLGFFKEAHVLGSVLLLCSSCMLRFLFLQLLVTLWLAIAVLVVGNKSLGLPFLRQHQRYEQRASAAFDELLMQPLGRS